MQEVSHKDIYDRLVAVESKVDHIDEQTAEVVAAFESAKGAFIALDWLSRFAGRILKIAGVIVAIGAATVVVWERLTK
tara:strand:- start:1184 stop:1417 length:234 start_codon:yes stop_codon:yes gene_type:complete